MVEGAEGQAGVKFQKPRDKQCEARANWGGARIRLVVEKRLEAQASVEIELEGWVFPQVHLVESADSGLQPGLQTFLTLKGQQKAGSPGRQAGTVEWKGCTEQTLGQQLGCA